jgi:hypothetical protein
MIGYRLYTALLYLLLPYVVFHLVWRGQSSLQHWELGYTARSLRPVIGCMPSVGEPGRAPLIKGAGTLSGSSDHHMTPTGRETVNSTGGCALRLIFAVAFPGSFRPRFSCC